MRNFFGARRARGLAVALLLAGTVLAAVGATAPASGVDPGTPVVTPQESTSGCNGVLPTPGSENTTKRLDPDFPSDFNPGGTVGYIIDYPVDPSDVAGRATFEMTDCVFVGDKAAAQYKVTFVPNTTDFKLRFPLKIAPDTPLGAQFCNYAKTTAAPSASQASNRKAGPACFTVGGSLRIEKRSGSTTGPLLEYAGFTVVCTPPAPAPGVTQQPTIITGLSGQSQSNPDGTVGASGTSKSGSIAISGPSGTPCTVTETSAPPGYQLDPTPRALSIPVGAAQEVNVFVNVQLADLVITKTTTGGSGTFTFNVDCEGTAFDQQTTITGSGSATVTGLPAGTHCTVTEVADPLFTSSSVPSDGKVTIAPEGTTVAFTNVRKTGSLVIQKTTKGGSGTFTFDVDCDGTRYTVTITGSGSKTIAGIPTGTSCTVKERADARFTSESTPTDGTVTIATGDNVVGFVNTRVTGTLLVTKTAVGGTGTFTFHVDCDGTDFDQTLTIESSGNASVKGIPTGTSCTVTEEPNPLFSPEVVPAGGTVVIAEGLNTVAFTNTRNTGNLVVAKTAVGGTGDFVFDVDCDGEAFDTTVTITGSGSQTLSGIPTTTSCTVTERPNDLFTTVSTPADGTVTIGATPVTVAFTNTAKPTGIAVDKKVDGGDHASAGSALVVHKGDTLTYTAVVTNTGAVPVTIASLADSLHANVAASCTKGVGDTLAPGASFSCTYGATAAGDAANVISVSAVDGLGRHSEAADSTFVKVINPLIALTKTPDVPSAAVGGTVTFTYAVTNTGDTPLHDVAVSDDVLGAVGPIGDLAPGATVTLTKSEVADGTTPTHNVGTVVGTDQLGLVVTASAGADIVVVAAEVIELPKTGGPISTLTLLGLGLLTAGLVLLGTTWRRRELI
ncbi:MAG TPA: DUF5979 domain-containing protein [Acidimicrobiales bacterium]|nr:DUF5979 domain-containing protein [Acidimicrobiales bacterium]